jgi:hypothetical protein
MKKSIRCDGIYDLRTLKFLLNLGLTDFLFDFTPSSPNFVQEHVLFNTLLPELRNDENIYFYFENYDHLMINRLLNKLQEFKFNNLNFSFEFKNINTDKVLDTNIKFNLNYNFSLSFDSHQKSKIVGFCLDYSFLKKLNTQSKLVNFVNNFNSKNSFIFRDNFNLICNLNDSDCFDLDFDFLEIFDFDTFSFKINPKLEVCYRNVDLLLVSKRVIFIQDLILNCGPKESVNGGLINSFQSI